jgi:hypothetical protein
MRLPVAPPVYAITNRLLSKMFFNYERITTSVGNQIIFELLALFG